MVDITTPPGSTLEQTKKTVQKVAEAVKDIEEVETSASIVGWNILGGDGATKGMMIMKLKPWDERSGSEHRIDNVMKKIEERIHPIKTGSMFTYALPTVTGYGFSDGIELYVQDYEGGSIDKLKEVTDRFAKALSERKEIGEVYNTYEVNFPQFTVSVNAAICKRYGIEPSAVLKILNGYIGGDYASQFNAFGKLYHVILQADPELRADKDDLNNILIHTNRGAYIPITELTTFKKSYGVTSLGRFNLYSTISIDIDPEVGYSTGEVIQAIAEVARQSLPLGYGYDFTGTTREEISSTANMAWIFLLVFVFIYLVLCSLYESMLIPMAVLLSVPFGIAGSFAAIYLTGLENNIYMQVGIIMLIGLMAKTAILLTEYASARRRDGLSIRDAALEAAKVRLRPILMTAMTLIIGLLPLVFATGAGAVGNISLGICVIAGMTVGTIALLFFVPVFFIIFQHLEEKYMPKRKMQKSVMPLIVSLLVFTSCGTYSNYHRQGSIINDSIVRSDLAQADDSLLTLHSSFSQGWHEVFTEPRLAALIEEGLAHNSNLNIAKLHVDAAKASLRHARGELFPSLELGAKGGTSRFKNSGNDPMTENRFGFRAETSWEVDIFGKLQNAKKAAAANVEEKAAYVQAVQVELIATIATCYFQLEMYDAQISETRNIVNSWDESVRAQKALMAVGEATSDEVNMAEASKLEAEETLEALQLQMIEAENALCVLLGRHSGHIERGDFLTSCEQMPLIPKVNIQTLATRPDIRQAEAALKKAFYLTNNARAAFYPSLNLSGIIGWTNDLDEVVSPAGLLMRALGSLTQPVFAKGKLRAEAKKAQAEQEEAKIAFRQAILKAGQEVNDALATRQYTQRAIKQISQQVEKLTDVLDATEKRMRYDSEVNYLQVLLARQELLEARLSLLSRHYGFLDSTIQLYKALGGDVMH
jgi:NodT family efflux transporter outer membrane factor (OMF) lipoprotein